MFDDISLFIAVVEAGSLKSASESLKIPSSTVSRRIKALEVEFGCKLLNRSSHNFEMTREGHKLFDSAYFHVNSVDSIINEIQNDISGDKGHIKVLAPTNLVASCLQRYMSCYLHQNPAIDLELELSNTLTEFYSSNADFAIRVGKQKDSDLTSIKLGKIETMLVASPLYIESQGMLEQLQDLEDADIIFSNPLTASWALFECANTNNRIVFKPRKRRIVVNDLQIAKQFSMSGLGITLLPSTEIKDELKSQQLVRVLPNWQGANRDVYAVWYRRQLLSSRASKLIDYLKQNVDF
ncbi:LysR family transcriptional regulator [Moritella sp.]|uniref:LysR family transcriptional regulator n=1 Tax=Moritella sp. TaxID=78556 RepID=UPI001D631230|nr:LysR family transcriptional regulator [Moritella sp.]MCJ8348564.1 LysR family transcriptional regulator [Moritella sp.]NQZ39077.1 LysR family transcriptional regulator [Moritella sp.]